MTRGVGDVAYYRAISIVDGFEMNKAMIAAIVGTLVVLAMVWWREGRE